MKNYINSGDAVSVTAAANVAAGKVVVVGLNLFGVALTSAATNETVALQTRGLFDLDKTTGASTSFAAGALVYWDATNALCTVSATSNTKVGCAVQAAANADTTVRVLMPARA